MDGYMRVVLKGDEREAGLGTRARGNVRGWLGRERER